MNRIKQAGKTKISLCKCAGWPEPAWKGPFHALHIRHKENWLWLLLKLQYQIKYATFNSQGHTKGNVSFIYLYLNP